MKKYIFSLIPIIVIIFGCTKGSKNPTEAHNYDTLQNQQVEKNSFDTIPYSLPEKTENIFYKDLSTNKWKTANHCFILFDPSYMTLSFSYKDEKNDELISSGFITNRVLTIKDRKFGVYFMSDYVFSRGHMNTGPIQRVLHKEVVAYRLDYVGDLIENLNE